MEGKKEILNLFQTVAGKTLAEIKKLLE